MHCGRDMWFAFKDLYLAPSLISDGLNDMRPSSYTGDPSSPTSVSSRKKNNAHTRTSAQVGWLASPIQWILLLLSLNCTNIGPESADQYTRCTTSWNCPESCYGTWSRSLISLQETRAKLRSTRSSFERQDVPLLPCTAITRWCAFATDKSEANVEKEEKQRCLQGSDIDAMPSDWSRSLKVVGIALC